MFVRITEVRQGDIILEGRSEIKVDRIEHNACSSFGTHVNDRDCYENMTKVRIKPGKLDEPIDETESDSDAYLDLAHISADRYAFGLYSGL